MKRRHALSVLGSAAVAGCLSVTPPGGATATGDEIGDSVGCPSFDDQPFYEGVSRVVCAPTSDASLTVTPAGQSGSLPTAEFSFELTNESEKRFNTNFYGWSVWKFVDGTWFHAAPRGWPIPGMSMPPGGSHAWNLAVDNADLDRPIPRAEGTEDLTLVGLGAGTYAFGIDGWFEGRGHEDKTAAAAHFELKGDPLELTPVGVEDVERDGDVVVVYAAVDREEYRANYTVTRVESPDEDAEAQEVIVEQVLRDTPLRNALAHFESGVRRVELRSMTTTYPPFGVGEPRFVGYDGDVFRIETAWEGDPPD